MIIECPQTEERPWPTLGPLLVRWMEKNLVFGPGDLRGEPLILSPARKMFIYRLYEIYPQDHKWAGRRRFRRGCLSIRKGRAKSELTAIIGAGELSKSAPVRCIGWDKRGNPIGGPVKDAYIPFITVTEEQTEELSYGALYHILSLSRIHKEFDIGLARIMRKDGSGKAVPLANAPDARDGARTTFLVCDETHRWTLPRLKASHVTMRANLPKRKLADPWMLEVTTAPAPGEGSVAEDTMDYAEAVIRGKKVDSDLYFFHEQATEEKYDLDNKEQRREAVIEASGGDVAWSDIDGICAQFDDQTQDRAYLCRVWLNQRVRAADRAFNVIIWDKRKRSDYVVPDGAWITLGFDGAVSIDSTGLVGTEMGTGFQFRIGLWERPLKVAPEKWRVPEGEVNEHVEMAFDRWNVWRLYADPYFWENWVATWTGRFGTEPLTSLPRVVSWPTNVRGYKMPAAVRAFAYAMQDEPPPSLGIRRPDLAPSDGALYVDSLPPERPTPPPARVPMRLSHDGDEAIRRHVSNCFRKYMTLRDAEGQFLWVVCKERPDSPNKIDGAMASILSWEARVDGIAAGVVSSIATESDYTVEWF